MSTQNTTQPTMTALDAYVNAQEEVRALVVALHGKINRHQNATAPEEIHWGHVGDIEAIAQALRQLLRP